MDSQLKDPDTLKCNVLQVLITYRNGINFGDFSGAFYQIHRFHPKFSHYGYSSLRELLDDMKETVVIEGNKSCGSVMKLVSNLNLDGLLEEMEKSGPDSVEENSRLKKEERKNREEDAAADLAEVLAAITNLLIEYESGLKFEKIQPLLLAANGIDLQSFVTAKGYKDILIFLSVQIPKLTIRHRGNLQKCVVQLSQDLTVVSVPICSILKFYPDGLKLSKLKEAVKKKCGYDLEVFCYQVGFYNIVSCLQEIPELIINRNKNRNCRIQLKPASFSCSSSQSKHSPSFDSEQPTSTSKNINQVATDKKPVPFRFSSSPSSSSSSSDSDQSTCTSNNLKQDESEKTPGLREVMALVTTLLSKYKMGLKIWKLQDFLLTEEGLDLEKFSIAQGYKDTVDFLKNMMPQLVLSYQTDRLNIVVIEPHTALNKVLELLTALLSRYMSGLRVKKLQYLLLEEQGIDLEKFSFALGHKNTMEFLEQKMPQLILNYRTSKLSTVVIKPHSGTAVPLKSAPAPINCSSSPSSYSSSSVSNKSTYTSNQDESEKMPVLSEVMASVTTLLSNYKKGLRIWKLQDFLLTEEGIDLEKFSIVQGYKDTMEFLERKMPQVILYYEIDRLNSVAIERHSDLKDNSKPASTVSDPSASDSQCQNIPTSIAVVPTEVNNLSRTNQSSPSTMSSNLPSFHESHNTLSVKAKSSSFSSVVLSQQPNPCQPSANSVTEEIPGNSQVTTFQPSTVRDELKQQVAQILAQHPKGMSLFQFRIVYSTTFKQHFPVGNAVSTKQRLLQMPDAVQLKGHGVQVLLFPVSHDVSPAKPGQPASSKVENVAVVPSLSLVHPGPVTEPAVKAFDSHSVSASPLESTKKPKSKDCHISKGPSMLLAPCQKQKARTSLTGFSDQLDLSKVEDIPVHPSSSSPNDESLIVPQSFLMPAVPKAVVMPVPKPRHSILQYYQSIRALENKGNKPFTELHTKVIPGSLKVMKMNKSHLNSPTPKLSETPLIPHCSAALPTYSQGTVCGENLQPVDSTPVPPVLVKPEIYSPGSASQSSDSIQPMLPVQPPPPMLSTEQRNYNRANAEFDTFSEVQKQSGASQHFSSPDFSAKRSVSSLPKNPASFFPSKSQLNHPLQQPTNARLDDLEPTSVSLADKSLGKASLDKVSHVDMYQRKPTYVNPLETSSTTESLIACSISGSSHTSSVITNNSAASPPVSSTTAVSSASSPLDSTANPRDQIAYASAEATSTPNVLSKSPAYHTPNAHFKTSLNHDPTQNNLTSSLSKQEDQSAPLQEKQARVTSPAAKTYKECLVL